MRILEVRDGFIKIETDCPIYISSFLLVEGDEKSYIAQITKVERIDNKNIALAKFLFIYNGNLLQYDKTLPPLDSNIKDFTSDILSNSLNATNPIITGKTFGEKYNITIDESAFNKKMLISVDDTNINNILIKNLSRQFLNLKKKVLIIDTLGIIKAKKAIAGIDFKIPLDSSSLSFVYQDCLNDATQDSKDLIVEIFKDLAEYANTVPFVPFDTLKNIIDDMVDKSHIFKLLVLKNKLAKFNKLGYFAKDKNQVDCINSILNLNCSVIDLSKLDKAFQNRYISYIYEKLEQTNNTHIFIELSNTISKKNLKYILSHKTIPTTLVTHSRFKYLEDMKNLFDNFIITPSASNNSTFYLYNTFLKNMSNNSYLIAGEAVNYMPLISIAEEYNDVIDYKKIENNRILKELENEPEYTENISEQEIDNNIQEASETNSIEEELSTSEISETKETHIQSNKDIIANIEEKSENIIAEVSKDLIVPNSMFSDEADNTETEENIIDNTDLNQDIIDDNAEQSEDFDQSQNNEEEKIYQPENNDINIEDDKIEDENIDDILSNLESDDVDINKDLDNSVEINVENPTEAIENIDEIDDLPETNLNNTQDLNDNENIENYDLSESNIQEVENPEDISNEIEIPADFNIELDDNSEEEITQDDIEDNNLTTEIENIESDNDETAEELDVIPINNNEDETSLEEIIELDPNESDDNDIIIDLTDDNEITALDEENRENLDEQIVKDVDKVFTTRKNEDISDTDLDIIDEINSDTNDDILEEISDNNELEEYSDINNEDGILEDVDTEQEIKDEENNEILETRNSSTPIVPVYDAEIPQEDKVVSDKIEQGDLVIHAKYGNGVVEKMIKYGNRTLYYINFETSGRKLLDPSITEIKKAGLS